MCVCVCVFFTVRDDSPWVILMRFSTVDSSTDSSVAAARHLWAQPNARQSALIQPGPWVWLRKWLWARGGGVEGMEGWWWWWWWWSLLFTRNENKNEPQWEGSTEMPHFSEWNYSAHAPSSLLSPHPLRSPLIGRASQSLTSGRLSCGWVRAQEHPFCLPYAPRRDRRRRDAGDAKREFGATLMRTRGSRERYHTLGTSLFIPVPSCRHRHHISASPSLSEERTDLGFCCKGTQKSCQQRWDWHSVECMCTCLCGVCVSMCPCVCRGRPPLVQWSCNSVIQQGPPHRQVGYTSPLWDVTGRRMNVSSVLLPWDQTDLKITCI